MAKNKKKRAKKKTKQDPQVTTPSSAAHEHAETDPPPKMKRKEYERRDAAPARRAGRDAGVGEGLRGQGLHRVRGPGHRRQGRHDQADHRAGEPAGVPRRRPARADRAREVADVRPALHPALPRRRRGRDLRPQLVQPRRRRAGDGLLHAGADRAVPRAGARRSRRRWSTPGSCC